MRCIAMKKQNIDTIIEGFDKLNLHFQSPKYSQQDVAEMEKSVNCKLPPDFKKTLLAGYINKGTFHFLPLERYAKDNRYLTFAKWNDDLFLFDTEAKTEDFPVYVIAGNSAPEKCFDNFYGWFSAVLNGVARANFPG